MHMLASNADILCWPLGGAERLADQQQDWSNCSLLAQPPSTWSTEAA